MPLFFTAPENIKENEEHILIYGKEARHIIKSLRYKINDQILVSDGQGNKYLSVIEDYKEQILKCKIISSISPANEFKKTKIVLAQSLLKGNKIDLVIQKSTELGISSLIPLVSSRTIPAVGFLEGEKKQKRWQKIAYEASKQSERSTVPKIYPITKFKELLKDSQHFDLSLIFWEKERSVSLKEVMTSTPEPATILSVIGPEGGFSEEEVELAKESGLKSVSLGSHYLRSETAAIFVLSVISYVFNL